MTEPLTARGLLFDMDGLLLDTERVAIGCWQAAERETGVYLPEGFYFSIIGQSIQHIEGRLRQIYDNGEAVSAFLKVANSHYLAALQEGDVPLKEGVRPLLSWLHEREIPICLATSTHRSLADHKLASTKLSGFFAKSVCGDEVEEGKPAPDIYLEAARRTGLPPHRLIALEDSENGLRAALDAGCQTIHIPDIAPVAMEVQVRASRVYRSLEGVLEAILREEIRFL